MEVLDQEFLIQDEEELDIFSKNVPIMLGDMNCNFDEYWWDVEFPKATEFESEIFVVMEEKEDGFVFVEDKKELLQAQMQKEEGQQQVDGDNVEEDEDEDDDTASDNQKKSKKSNEANSKNLQSERNRRKRLNQQLFTLRSLVPNITKMDKRSILADALAYLRSLLQDIEKEIEKNSSLTSESSSSIVPDDASLPVQLITPPYERCAAHPAITQMNAQMLQDATFVLEIGCNKAIGAVCQVQRSIEMLGVKITCSSVNGLNRESMIITAFVRVKKKSLVTPEKLLDQLELNARQLGLHLPTDSA